MKVLISHINFLITKHNCVIVPGFGGFVVNREASRINDGKVLAPNIVFAFNEDLKYNDGLLAESYMNEKGISYEKACDEINEAVKKINTYLSLQKKLTIGRIGELSIDDASGSLIFTPADNVLFHPLIFGYANLKMKPLTIVKEIKDITAKKRNKVELKRILSGVAAAAAAILVFFISSTPILEVKDTIDIQKSGFITSLSHSNGLVSSENISNNAIPEVVTTDISIEPAQNIVNEVSIAQETNQEQIETVKPTEVKTVLPVTAKVNTERRNTPRHYVIIAGESNKNTANKTLARIQSQGFSSAKTLPSAKRTRIYVASFDSRQDAETYLVKFKIKHPQFHDAWVLSQK